MTLAAGSRLGPYEILAPLGAGGMGEVWRARDSKLGREVALKVLPQSFAADAERLARFEREAQLLAQLHHPNIASIFGLEEAGEVRALVMELVEGPTLAERIASGPLPLEDALGIARQIAEALEAAHEKGIVHRDLKPHNVKLAPGGAVKVLDFGLAKAMDPVAGAATTVDLAHSPTLMNSPTLTAVHGTQLGVILGTAAYMAPEQARGSAVDKRADVWAFGVVLHEMLSGRSLFAGPTVSDTLAGVLKTEVDWQALPAGTPAAIRDLLRRCLERNPKNRLHDIADARIVLDDVLAGRADEPVVALPAAVAPARSRSTWWLAGIAGALLIGLLAGALLSRQGALPEPELRFPLAFPEGWRFADADTPLVAISRDGRRRAVAAAHEDGREALLVAEAGEIDWRELPGTAAARTPFFSPDGAWVGFFGEDRLMRVAIEGGPPVPVASAGNQVRGAVWLADGSIVYSPDAGEPLWRVPDSGGERQSLTTLRAEGRERTHRWPDALPDGSAVIFTMDSDETTEFYDDATIEAVVVATGERRILLRGASQARYLDPGVLVFARGGSLFATRFDPRKLEVQGAPVPVQQKVATTVASGAVQFAVSASGALLWAPGEAQAFEAGQPVWIGRDGARSAPLTGEGTHIQLELSPDGRRLAVVTNLAGKSDIWIVDLETGSRSRLTFDGDVADPSWSADGRRVAYYRAGAAVGGGSDIYWKLADGSGEGEPLVSGPDTAFSPSFSPDGRTVVFDGAPPGQSHNDIWTMTLDAERRRQPFLATPAMEFGGRFSPDGRFLAYVAREAGRTEVFVRPFPPGGGQWQISNEGGIEPNWSRDGRELFFRDRGVLYRVAVDTRQGFAAGSPERIAPGFRSGDNVRTYSPALDGKRFVALAGWEVSAEAAQVNLALHWDREVRRRLSRGR